MIQVTAYVPDGHELQVDDDVDPVAVLYLPAAHDVHEVCPVELWYLIRKSKFKQQNGMKVDI
jgi:hypothetical protein